jgi:ribosomal protein S18 acetylase RimI-like enzyme
MTISIREALSQDIDAVIRVWKCCDLTRPWNDAENDFNLALGGPSSAIFLAEVGTLLVGTVMTGFDGHRGWIYYLGILPNHRKHGIAKQLMDAAAVWLGDRNCPKIELMVRSGNPAADFYKKNGWEKQDVEVYARWLKTKDE